MGTVLDLPSHSQSLLRKRILFVALMHPGRNMSPLLLVVHQASFVLCPSRLHPTTTLFTSKRHPPIPQSTWRSNPSWHTSMLTLSAFRMVFRSTLRVLPLCVVAVFFLPLHPQPHALTF